MASVPQEGLEVLRRDLEALKAELAELHSRHVEIRCKVWSQTESSVRLLNGPPPEEPEEPIISRERWQEMPGWISLDWCRGHLLPSLEADPLFHGPGNPCILPFFPSGKPGRGSIIVAPGGNYEFLTPQEAEPVAKWLVDELQIPVFVLRYRLLPEHGMLQMMEDFLNAVRGARRFTGPGPVAAIGFSAGAHLAACAFGAATARCERTDAQVFMYPVIDPEDWFSQETSGFFQANSQSAEVMSLAMGREDLLPGHSFAAPPTLLISSTADNVCPPEKHSDLYAEAMKDAGVPFEYLRGDFGDHGFCHEAFWREPCLRWLRSQGFGVPSRQG